MPDRRFIETFHSNELPFNGGRRRGSLISRLTFRVFDFIQIHRDRSLSTENIKKRVVTCILIISISSHPVNNLLLLRKKISLFFSKKKNSIKMIDYDKIHDDIIIINNNRGLSIYFLLKEKSPSPKKKFQPIFEQSIDIERAPLTNI